MKKKTFQKLHSKYQTIKNLSQSKYSSREEIKICLNCTKKITGKFLNCVILDVQNNLRLQLNI